MKPQFKMIELHPQAQEAPPEIGSPAALTVDVPAFVPVQHYTWQDKGIYVQLQITTMHHIAGARAESASLVCSRTSSIPSSISDKAPQLCACR